MASLPASTRSPSSAASFHSSAPATRVMLDAAGAEAASQRARRGAAATPPDPRRRRRRSRAAPRPSRRRTPRRVGHAAAVSRAPSPRRRSSARSRARASSQAPAPAGSSKPTSTPLSPWRSQSACPPYGVTTLGVPAAAASRGGSPRPSLRESLSSTSLDAYSSAMAGASRPPTMRWARKSRDGRRLERDEGHLGGLAHLDHRGERVVDALERHPGLALDEDPQRAVARRRLAVCAPEPLAVQPVGHEVAARAGPHRGGDVVQVAADRDELVGGGQRHRRARGARRARRAGRSARRRPAAAARGGGRRARRPPTTSSTTSPPRRPTARRSPARASARAPRRPRSPPGPRGRPRAARPGQRARAAAARAGRRSGRRPRAAGWGRRRPRAWPRDDTHGHDRMVI